MSDFTTERAGQVLIFTLNRPEKLNALSPEMQQGLVDALEQEHREPSARALLIRAAGRGFCVGADVAPEKILARRKTIRASMEGGINRVITLIRDLPIPVVTAVNGPAAGAGVSLALSGDIVLAAHSAEFHLAFVRIGAVLDGGLSYFLNQALGPAKAAKLAMLGETLDAEQAERLGVVSERIADEHLQAEAMALAERLANGPTRSLAMIKQELQRGATSSLAEALSFEAECQGKAFLNEDFEEGILAFRDKRKAHFQGR